MMNYLLYFKIGEFSFQTGKFSEDKNNIDLNNLKFGLCESSQHLYTVFSVLGTCCIKHMWWIFGFVTVYYPLVITSYTSKFFLLRPLLVLVVAVYLFISSFTFCHLPNCT